MRRGVLRHLLGVGSLKVFGNEDTEVSYQGGRSRPLHPYQCPVKDCRGVTRARRPQECLGVGAWHSAKVMRIIDDEGAPPDTPGLVTQ